MSAVVDTHAAIWYVFVRKRLSQDALRFIRRAVDSGKPVYVSAISIVETVYLIERGRVPFEAIQRIEAALKDPASGMLVTPLLQERPETVARLDLARADPAAWPALGSRPNILHCFCPMIGLSAI